ncbi:hypothetical protein SAMN05518672_11222 [Chitinophaga sp. CF118]|nr:hypothetical protein SAMN05518672_11222 [Chitinophaga sp. CF118]
MINFYWIIGTPISTLGNIFTLRLVSFVMVVALVISQYVLQVPKEVRIKDKTIPAKLRLIEQLEEENGQARYRVIDTMLAKSKFKYFFHEYARLIKVK